MAVSKKLVEKFETTKKTAAAMIDRGDVVEIMGIQPAVGRTSAKQASFAKPSSGTAHNRSPQSSPRASPQPVDVEEGVSSRYNKMTVKHKTKDQKEVPALQDICQKQERDLQAIMGSLDESSRRKMNETFKRTSASEENLLSAGSGGGYRLNDVMDVKQLAKMQEESKTLLLLLRISSCLDDSADDFLLILEVPTWELFMKKELKISGIFCHTQL
jgi:hypothetical protein